MNDDLEIIAIFIDEPTTGAMDEDIDFTATSCLLRDSDGTVSIRPAAAVDAERFDADGSGIFLRSEPILDPSTGDVIGYELEEDEHRRVVAG